MFRYLNKYFESLGSSEIPLKLCDNVNAMCREEKQKREVSSIFLKKGMTHGNKRTVSGLYSFLDVPFIIRDHFYLKFHVIDVLNGLLFGSQEASHKTLMLGWSNYGCVRLTSFGAR